MVNKITWINILKAIGIVLVVVGHVTQNQISLKLIYAFHMPLFFFASGLVFNAEKSQDLLLFINKRIKSILIPYFVGGIFLLWYGARYGNRPIDLNNMIAAIFQGDGTLFEKYSPDFSVPLWFLPSLFSTMIIYALINKVVKTNIWAITAFVLVIFLLGCLYLTRENSVFGVNRMPWGIDLLPITILFVHLGAIYRQIDGKIKPSSQQISVIIAIPLFIIGALYNQDNSRVDMLGRSFHNIILYVVVSVIGIFCAIQLSKIVLRWNIPVIEYIGENSLIILVLHTWAFNVTMKCFYYVAYNLLHHKPIDFNENLYWLQYMIIFLGVCIPLAIKWIVKRNMVLITLRVNR